DLNACFSSAGHCHLCSHTSYKVSFQGLHYTMSRRGSFLNICKQTPNVLNIFVLKCVAPSILLPWLRISLVKARSGAKPRARTLLPYLRHRDLVFGTSLVTHMHCVYRSAPPCKRPLKEAPPEGLLLIQ
ncbi:hypothetical protein GOODEAATRI_013234, partial [Goodea atripinnis]